jgi:pyrroline-5-carboxylate reductase
VQTIAILGCGTMGEAILGGRQAVDDGPRVTVVSARREERAHKLAERYGVVAVTDNAAAARQADIALLAVKPQAASRVLNAPGVNEALEGKLLISICAGVSTAQLAAWAPGSAVVRAMPNTPCLIRQGMTVVSRGPRATAAHIDTARQIFEAVGRCVSLDEKHLDAVTGLSGSGPAFICVILEALADGGVRMGLPRDVAVELAAQTTQGAARMVLETGRHPAALKDEVTTPAGCTIAGLLTMEDGRIRSILARTIEEAARVASGLGQPE